MSDSEEHHFESKADAGASKTYPMQAGAIRKNGHIVIKNRPCKVVEVSTSKTGKHGHAKCHFVAIDIFNGKKLEDIVPSSHNCDVPHVDRTEYQLIDISEDGYVSLLTDNGNTKDDLKLPTDETILRQDNFDMFHAQDLAQLAAQVVQKAELEEAQSGEQNPKITHQLAYTKYSILDQAHNSSFSSATSAQTSQHVSSSVIMPSMRCVPTLPSHTECIKTESNRVSQVLQGASITLDRPADDGYNWRKYGQKAVKGGRYPRSYYKCTLNCPVRKNVEHSEDGKIIKIIYRGQHSHERPSKRYKDCDILLKESDDFNDTEDASTKSQLDCLGYDGRPVTSIGTVADYLLPMREGGDEKVSGTSDNQGEGDDGTQTADEAVRDTDANERNAPGQKIIVSTTSDVDLLDDGYRWRKYGQKVVRGNPHPRSYYKCTHQGCDVKKHIERSSQEPHAVITTYEGKHVHDVPVSRNRRHDAGQPYCTEQTYSEQSSASFCSRSEKKAKYSTIILKHLAF